MTTPQIETMFIATQAGGAMTRFHEIEARRGCGTLRGPLRAAIRIRVKNTQIDDSAADCLGGGEIG